MDGCRRGLRRCVDYYCYETKRRGGAAIVYRTSRLSLVAGSDKFVRLKQRLTVGGSCVLDDWRAMVMRLSDDNTPGKFVNVASVHLPYNPDVADADCSWDNIATRRARQPTTAWTPTIGR